MIQTAQTHNRLKALLRGQTSEQPHILAVLGDYLIAAGQKIRDLSATDAQQPV
jgi:hypothetical protein